MALIQNESDWWVYVARDIHGRVLYVGATGRGLARLYDHQLQAVWTRHVASLDIEHRSSSIAALARERELIRLHRPPYNVHDKWGPERLRTRGGRPSVADRPELLGRIERLRDQGLTLQAIADELNAEGVPTARGAPAWRPSSVQAATGYRRP